MHSDKRTGIVYTNVDGNNNDGNNNRNINKNGKNEEMQPHLDAFIPTAFLKSYFDGKSNT
jgi:hypothetical protein